MFTSRCVPSIERINSMAKRKILALNIVLIPDHQVMVRAIEVSQQINRWHPSDLVLDSSHHLPHISLYQLSLPADNLIAAKEKIALAAECQPLQIVTAGYDIYLGQSIFWLMNSSFLSNLHHQLIGGLNSLREGYLLDSHARSLTSRAPVDLDLRARQVIADCGDPLSRDLFNPHITLAYFTKPGMAQQVRQKLPEATPLEFTAGQLALARLGPQGTCSKILEWFDLAEVDIWEGHPPQMTQQRAKH